MSRRKAGCDAGHLLSTGPVSLGPLTSALEVLSRVDAMVLNAEEQSLARDQIEAVASRGLVAITRGPLPAQILDRGRSHRGSRPFPTRAVDDAGAGDVFASTLFILRAEQEPTIAAGRMAAIAAGLRIQQHGPEAVPTREAVEDFLATQPTVGKRGARDPSEARMKLPHLPSGSMQHV